jgi:hypothetical protein
MKFSNMEKENLVCHAIFPSNNVICDSRANIKLSYNLIGTQVIHNSLSEIRRSFFADQLS